jgi:hypothetical protein
MDVDIFIAPLVDNLFNRCKSSIKYWEYSALGIGGVYSNLDPYARVITNGENGFLASTPEEWYQVLKLLIDNRDLRHNVAQSAYLHYVRQGKMSLHLEEWSQIYSIDKHQGNYVERSTPFQQAFYRFAQQLIERSMEGESLMHNQQKYIEQLERRNRDLDAILNSRSWRLVQWIGKLRRLGRH